MFNNEINRAGNVVRSIKYTPLRPVGLKPGMLRNEVLEKAEFLGFISGRPTEKIVLNLLMKLCALLRGQIAPLFPYFYNLSRRQAV
jgi:hypothetical protein